MPSEDLPIRPGLVIPGDELTVQTSTSGGPGGQHANKTSTRVTVRWSVRDSAVLRPSQRAQLLDKLAPRLTSEGELLVTSDDSRSQSANKETARERLAELVRTALVRLPPRRPTRPSRRAKQRRLDSKKQTGTKKKMRGKVRED